MVIKELRTKLGMTQKEFAAYMGIPLSTIRHWEIGYRTPPDYVISLIKRVIVLSHPDIDIE